MAVGVNLWKGEEQMVREGLTGGQRDRALTRCVYVRMLEAQARGSCMGSWLLRPQAARTQISGDAAQTCRWVCVSADIGPA